MSENAENDARPVALCCCGTPLVSTFERPGAEWYCVGCADRGVSPWYGWLHAGRGGGPNPTPELEERAARAREQYDAERAARREGRPLPPATTPGGAA